VTLIFNPEQTDMKMKYFLLIILMAFFPGSCINRQIIETSKKDPLALFLEQCEKDINSAGRVILEKDIIKNLTHLKFMDSGGKKYYLLERENISKMIHAVTEGVYEDFILIHKNGEIIYTKINNDIFGKNVKTSLKDTRLNACYTHRNSGVFFSDVTELPGYDSGFFIYVSVKITGGGTTPGIFVLQFSADKILQACPPGTEIISGNGLIVISAKSEGLNRPYRYFDTIMKLSSGKGSGSFRTDSGEKKLFRFFNYGSISWIIVSAG